MSSHRRAYPDPGDATEVFDAFVETDLLHDPRAVAGPDVVAIHGSREFQDLRRRRRRFAFRMTAAFLAWYLVFVLLSAFAPELTSTPVFGAVNLGMVLGLSQFVSTLAIVVSYQRFARRWLDPGVDALQRVHDPRESRPVR